MQPNHLTLAAVGVSAVAGAAVAFGSRTTALLATVPLLYLLRMALNAMDGMLARDHAMSSRSGVILNEVGDVVSDAVSYLPFVLVFPQSSLLIVSVVVLGLVAEVAALAAAGELGRKNDGPLGKSDRALGFGVLATLGAAGGASLVPPALAVMAVLGAATIRNRMVAGIGGGAS